MVQIQYYVSNVNVKDYIRDYIIRVGINKK